MGNTSLTQTIAQQAVSYEAGQLPPDVRKVATLACLDNIGCAIRGTAEPLSQILAQELFVKQIMPLDVLPSTNTGALSNQAMLYAASAHAIDFDDTLIPAMAAHTGSVVLGALLPLTREMPVSGPEFLTAVVAGFETAARIGPLLQLEHYDRGFHPTGTVGVFAAAAASGRLLNFDTSTMCTAFGLAATQASGLKCTFGTMAKPFNAAHAASAGLLAARLAQKGFTAPTDAIEATKGYLDLFLGRPDAEREVASPDSFGILQNAFKLHAACHATHPMIEAISTLRTEHGISADQVDSMNVTTTQTSLVTASIGEPETGLQGKFSFSHVAAIALSGYDTASDEAFSEEAISDDGIRQLRQRITLQDTEEHPFLTNVTVRLKSGETASTRLDLRILMQDLDSTGQRLEQKFISNTSPALGEPAAHDLKSRLLGINEMNDLGADLSAEKLPVH